MKLAPCLAALCMGAAWTPAALAQGEAPGSGWYLGGGLRPAPTAVEDTDIGYRHFGGYRFTRNWGVEFGYSDLGRNGPDGTPATYAEQRLGYRSSAWTLAGTGVLPLGDAFSLQGRVGLSLASPEASQDAAGNGNGAHNGFSTALPRYRPMVLWGVGGQYDLSDRVGLRLDYNSFGRLNDDPNGVRSDLWSINAVVRF
jgi:OOP family OmpA-OmpF porin